MMAPTAAVMVPTVNTEIVSVCCIIRRDTITLGIAELDEQLALGDDFAEHDRETCSSAACWPTCG